jgi:hypothetical protein
MNAFIMTAILVLSTAVAADAATYRWTDSQGVIHFTDSFESVPSEYLHKIVKEEDITIRNPQIREEVRQEEERARQEEACRSRTMPTPESVVTPPPQVTPAKPENELVAPRPKSVRVRENMEWREAEEKVQQPATLEYEPKHVTTQGVPAADTLRFNVSQICR